MNKKEIDKLIEDLKFHLFVNNDNLEELLIVFNTKINELIFDKNI